MVQGCASAYASPSVRRLWCVGRCGLPTGSIAWLSRGLSLVPCSLLSSGALPHYGLWCSQPVLPRIAVRSKRVTLKHACCGVIVGHPVPPRVKHGNGSWAGHIGNTTFQRGCSQSFQPRRGFNVSVGSAAMTPREWCFPDVHGDAALWAGTAHPAFPTVCFQSYKPCNHYDCLS